MKVLYGLQSHLDYTVGDLKNDNEKVAFMADLGLPDFPLGLCITCIQMGKMSLDQIYSRVPNSCTCTAIYFE